MFFLPVGWEYEHAIGVDAVRYCGCSVDWRHLAAPIPTEEVGHVQPGNRATTTRDFTRRHVFGRAPRNGLTGGQSTGIPRKPRLEQVNGNGWDHRLPEREHTPNDLQSAQAMPAVPQRDARLADADACV